MDTKTKNTKTALNLNADKRTITGRKVKALRQEGLLPGNVFGKGIKSIAIQINTTDFGEVKKSAGETSIITLMLGSQKLPVLISNTQVNPVTDEPVHVDLRQVNLKEKVTATVKVELLGESPAQKSGLGTLLHQTTELEVEALPLDLPEKLVLDISKMKEVDQPLTIKDLVYDKIKIEILSSSDQVVAIVVPQKKEEEPEVVEAESTEEQPEEEEPKEDSIATETQNEPKA